MSDELHKYPGNLKHHKVDKEEQRKLLSDIMADDAKDGLYDTAKRKPLLSDADIESLKDGRMEVGLGMKHARQVYEAARAKDEELIQRLVNCLHAVANLSDRDADERATVARPGLEAAAAAGFKI